MRQKPNPAGNTINMKSGAIGVVAAENSDAKIDTSEFPRSHTVGGRELQSAVEVEWGQKALDGEELYRGRAATEDVEKIKTTRIDSTGRIETGVEKEDVVPHVTSFLCSPSEFVITESTNDEFAHELLEDTISAPIRPGEVDLEAFAKGRPNAEPWLGWWSSSGPVDTGAAIGDINSEPDLAKFVHGNENNFLGLKNLEYNGRRLKLAISKSGWVAVYEPKDMDTIEFSRFVRNEILPFTSPKV